MDSQPPYEDLIKQIEALKEEIEDLRKTVPALRASEEMFRELVEGSLQGIVIHRDHAPLFVNPSYAAIYGYTQKEILDMDSIIPLFAVEEHERLKGYNEKRLRGENVPEFYEYRGIHKNGSLIWIENKVRIVEWEGKPAILTTIFDISQRKQTEIEIKESEERYRVIMESADRTGQGVMLLQDTGEKEAVCVYANQAASEITGYSRGELTGVSWIDVLHPKDKTGALDRYRRRLEGEFVDGIYDLSVLSKEGMEVPIEIYAAKAEALGEDTLIAFFRDITRRSQAQDALLKSEENHRQLIENAVVGVYQISKGGRYRMVNRKLASTFGYGSVEEFLEAVDHVSRLYVYPGQREEILSEIDRNGFIEGKELELSRKDGSRVWIELNTRMTTDDQGLVIYEGTAEDITARKNAEETLRQHNAYLSALHEISLGLAKHLELNDVLEAIVSHLRRIAGTEAGYVYLCDEEKDHIEMRIGLGLQKKYIGLKLKPGEGLAGKVWENRQMMVIDDYATFNGRLPPAKFDGARAVACIPLVAESGVLGVIGLSHFEEGKRFTTEQVSVLSQFAQLASIALDNARLYSELKKELVVRREIEAALRESEMKYKTLTEDALSGIFIHQDDKYVYVNNIFAEMYGYSTEELFEMTHYDTVHPDHKEMVIKRAKDRLAGKEVPKQYELKKIRKNGETTWHEIIVGAPIMYQGKPAIMGHEVDITGRKKAEEQLRRAKADLEHRVELRTTELKQSNEQLEFQKKSLEEVNTALRVLLKKRDDDKTEMERKVMLNVNEMIKPYLDKLRLTAIDNRQKMLVDIAESNLDDIVSPFSQSITGNYTGFTPSEMQIAGLIKQGRTSKEIAELLNVSSKTVETHRRNVRKKLNLDNRKVNLRTHLLSMQ